MKKNKFVLPEKWCIYLDEENIEELTKFYNSHIKEYDGCSDYTISKGNSFHYPQHERNAHSWGGRHVVPGYTKITFEEFKKAILDKSEIIKEDLRYLVRLFKKLGIK